MKSSAFVLTCITSFFASTWTPCLGVGSYLFHLSGYNFCYNDQECGSRNDSWGGVCKTGKAQSPIALPKDPVHWKGSTELDLRSYRGKAFRMQNDGHTVKVEFIKSRPKPTSDTAGFSFSNEVGEYVNDHIFTFPNPSKYLARAERALPDDITYKFHNAHFHWGKGDFVGSEHCIGKRCFSMELHLVHYLSSYKSLEDAVLSGDENSLAVIAVMLDVSPFVGPGNPTLAPIILNLKKIMEPSDTHWENINVPLDFTPLLATLGQNHAYIYKGSLTTPECREQVNWYVMDKHVSISHNDVKRFRFLRGRDGKRIKHNNRPLQNVNNRLVYLSAVEIRSK